MVRVLVLTNFYPPHHLGGYELSCRDVMSRMAEAGHEVTVLTTTYRRPGVADAPGERQAGVRRDLEFWWDDHVLTKPFPLRRLWMERGNQRALAAAIELARPDVVSVWNMGASSMGLVTAVARRGIPLLFSICDDWLVYGPKLDAWTRMFAGRRRLGRTVEALTGIPSVLPDAAWPGAYCFVSDFTRKRAQEQTRWRYEPSTVVYSGIEHAEFPPLPKATELPWQGRLLYVGRVEHRKGIETLLRAMGRLPATTTLHVVGPVEPAYWPVVTGLLAELDLAKRVTFAEVPRPELRAIYASADCFVFPSAWDEPFGLVPVEAMACGTPVVATGTGGSAEFLRDGANCLLFPARDDVALAERITRLAEDEDLRRRLVDGGLLLAGQLSVDRLAETLEAWHVAAADGLRELPLDRSLSDL